MIKVKIKWSGFSPPEREALLNKIAYFKVKCSKVQKYNDFFLIWCDGDSDVDNLFSPNCIEALGSISCTPQLPPEMKARRTILLKYVDELVHRRNDADIVSELQRNNSWLSVTDLFTFSNSATIKLTCATVAMANKAKDVGVLLFNFFIPPRNIAIDEYINLIMCYRCYTYDDHYASACPKPKEYKICSLCSSREHTHKSCHSQEKTCINCGGAHSAMALSYPHRKTLIKEKRAAKTQRSYAAAAKPGTPQPSPMNMFTGTSEIIAKSVMCIVVSALKNAETPGSFADTMQHLLKANNLPAFNLGDITPPTMLSGEQTAEVTTTPP